MAMTIEEVKAGKFSNTYAHSGSCDGCVSCDLLLRNPQNGPVCNEGGGIRPMMIKSDPHKNLNEAASQNKRYTYIK